MFARKRLPDYRIQARARQLMTSTVSPTRPTAPPARTKSDDSYEDVVEMFVALRQLPAESHEYGRLRERIVTRCLPLADHVASHFARRGEGLDDLVQVARLGLMNAIKRFDPDKGPSFIGFAVPTMMGEVRRYFRDHTWGMRVPRRLRELHVQISRTTAELSQQLGRAPTAGELPGSSASRTRRSSNAWSRAMPIGLIPSTHREVPMIRERLDWCPTR